MKRTLQMMIAGVALLTTLQSQAAENSWSAEKDGRVGSVSGERPLHVRLAESIQSKERQLKLLNKSLVNDPENAKLLEAIVQLETQIKELGPKLTAANVAWEAEKASNPKLGTPPDLNAQRFSSSRGITTEGAMKLTAASGLLSGLAIILLDDQEKNEIENGKVEQSSTATTGVNLELNSKTKPTDAKPYIRNYLKNEKNREQVTRESTR